MYLLPRLLLSPERKYLLSHLAPVLACWGQPLGKRSTAPSLSSLSQHGGGGLGRSLGGGLGGGVSRSLSVGLERSLVLSLILGLSLSMTAPTWAALNSTYGLDSKDRTTLAISALAPTSSAMVLAANVSTSTDSARLLALSANTSGERASAAGKASEVGKAREEGEAREAEEAQHKSERMQKLLSRMMGEPHPPLRGRATPEASRNAPDLAYGASTAGAYAAGASTAGGPAPDKVSASDDHAGRFMVQNSALQPGAREIGNAPAGVSVGQSAGLTAATSFGSSATAVVQEVTLPAYVTSALMQVLATRLQMPLYPSPNPSPLPRTPLNIFGQSEQTHRRTVDDIVAASRSYGASGGTGTSDSITSANGAIAASLAMPFVELIRREGALEQELSKLNPQLSLPELDQYARAIIYQYRYDAQHKYFLVNADSTSTARSAAVLPRISTALSTNMPLSASKPFPETAPHEQDLAAAARTTSIAPEKLSALSSLIKQDRARLSALCLALATALHVQEQEEALLLKELSSQGSARGQNAATFAIRDTAPQDSVAIRALASTRAGAASKTRLEHQAFEASMGPEGNKARAASIALEASGDAAANKVHDASIALDTSMTSDASGAADASMAAAHPLFPRQNLVSINLSAPWAEDLSLAEMVSLLLQDLCFYRYDPEQAHVVELNAQEVVLFDYLYLGPQLPDAWLSLVPESANMAPLTAYELSLAQRAELRNLPKYQDWLLHLPVLQLWQQRTGGMVLPSALAQRTMQEAHYTATVANPKQSATPSINTNSTANLAMTTANSAMITANRAITTAQLYYPPGRTTETTRLGTSLAAHVPQITRYAPHVSSAPPSSHLMQAPSSLPAPPSSHLMQAPSALPAPPSSHLTQAPPASAWPQVPQKPQATSDSANHNRQRSTLLPAPERDYLTEKDYLRQ